MNELLSILLKKELSFIDEFEKSIPHELFSRIISPQETMEILRAADAFWVYDGLPRAGRPHALLHSGKHSNGFIDVGSVLKNYPNIRKVFAHSLSMIVVQNNILTPMPINWVVGADTSSTLLAEDVAEFLNVKHIKMKKIDDGKEKKQIWDKTNPDVGTFHSIGLQVEELITTAASALEVRGGMNEAAEKIKRKFIFNRIIPVIVNRSDPNNKVTKIGNSLIRPLLSLGINNYEPDECPYCKADSEAIKPKLKETDNWARLTAK